MSRYQFIEQVAATEPVQVLCRVLAVSAAGYYQWLGRAVRSTPSWESAATAAFSRHAQRYGRHPPLAGGIARRRPRCRTRCSAQLLSLLEKRYARELALLCSIPGIGRKTAALLLLFARGFTAFDNYRQLIAKAGLSPREHSSGTSIRGKVSITKMGGGLIRSKLYMCSLSAKRGNAACHALYERLVAKGKNGKVALIAVCNKLLKQALAIIKSGVPCQADFTGNLT